MEQKASDSIAGCEVSSWRHLADGRTDKRRWRGKLRQHPLGRMNALSDPATCSRRAALGPLDRTGVSLASWSGHVRSRVRQTGVAFPYTPFQGSDALRMILCSPWEVLRLIIAGTVGTLLWGLLFRMMHRAGLSRSQSHRRRSSGVFGLLCGECVLRGSTGCCSQFNSGRWGMCPGATDRHDYQLSGLDRHVRFPHDGSGQAGSHPLAR